MIEQAVDMLRERGLSADQALARIRTYAQLNQLGRCDVARKIIHDELNEVEVEVEVEVAVLV